MVRPVGSIGSDFNVRYPWDPFYRISCAGPGRYCDVCVLTWSRRVQGWQGLLTGVGLPVLYVAWRNRFGPGDVCTRILGGGQACVQEWRPWPWLAAGLFFIGCGLVTFIVLSAHTRS